MLPLPMTVRSTVMDIAVIIPALESYTHEYKPYDPYSALFHWLHIVISNVKAFILGTSMACPRNTSNPIWTSIPSASATAILVLP